MSAMLGGGGGVGSHSCSTLEWVPCLHFVCRRFGYPTFDVLISDPNRGAGGRPLHPFHRRDALPRRPFKDGGDGAAMPQKDAPRASADTAWQPRRNDICAILPRPCASHNHMARAQI